MLTLVPWTTRRSNQSILKEISPGCSLERLMLKLKLQYLGHQMQRADSRPWCWERLRAGREEDDRGWEGWVASPNWWHEFEQDLGVGEGQRSLVCCSPWCWKESNMTERLNWTEHTPEQMLFVTFMFLQQDSVAQSPISIVNLHPCTDVTA